MLLMNYHIIKFISKIKNERFKIRILGGYAKNFVR